jgi:hypothetical protein
MQYVALSRFCQSRVFLAKVNLSMCHQVNDDHSDRHLTEPFFMSCHMEENTKRLPRLPVLWLPGWLYESIPFVYLISGIATIIYYSSLFGYYAGGMLIIAAVLILKMRIDYRTARDAVRLAQDLIEGE